ncbi:MAG TPA: GNAT family N-acetyltransferase [Stellaceae bacterium]|nr:GNAT family N-acetyltransferase [Stellaceae bacterium]
MGNLGAVGAPERLGEGHVVERFRCGNADLDNWLARHARGSEGRSARTYVVTDGNRVVGYYCLAAASVGRGNLPSARLRRNLPDQVPAVVLGRLAVDGDYAGRGIGKGLVKDAMRRCLAAANAIGVRAMLVHAIDERAGAFYRKLGFLPLSEDERRLILPLETIAEGFSG